MRKRWSTEDNALYVIGTIYGMCCKLAPSWDTPANFTNSCTMPLHYLDMFVDIASSKMTACHKKYVNMALSYIAKIDTSRIERPSLVMQGAYQLGYYAGKNGQYLKFLRLCKNLTQTELADKSGVPFSSICKFEYAQRDIKKANADTLSRIAKAIDCNIEDLIGSDASD